MKKLSELGISPAPWKVDDRELGCDNEIWCEYISDKIVKGEKRAKVVARCNAHFDTYNADARLIAATPKMYAKAWELITAFDNRVMSPKHIEALRKALAEAAGEEAKDDN